MKRLNATYVSPEGQWARVIFHVSSSRREVEGKIVAFDLEAAGIFVGDPFQVVIFKKNGKTSYLIEKMQPISRQDLKEWKKVQKLIIAKEKKEREELEREIMSHF